MHNAENARVFHLRDSVYVLCVQTEFQCSDGIFVNFLKLQQFKPCAVPVHTNENNTPWVREQTQQMHVGVTRSRGHVTRVYINTMVKVVYFT
jgi:hypothetical protein